MYKICPECEAFNETCCAAAKGRKVSAAALYQYAESQSAKVAALLAALIEAKALIRKIMAENKI